MNSQEAFLKAIAENEDDQVTRLVYANFLEESGLIDEAIRQRTWIAAKQELIELLELYVSTPPAPINQTTDPFDDDDYDDDSYSNYTFHQLIDAMNEQEDDIIFFGSHENTMDLYRANMEQTWRPWSIITGKTPPINLPFGSCSC